MTAVAQAPHGNKPASGPVTMESRKLLGAINSSAQSKIALIEGHIREMGRQSGRDWGLTALTGEQLYIEDRETHDYYLGSLRREKGGRFVIENIRPIQVVEGKKKSLFEQSCNQLIDALERNDQKGMAAAYSRMARERFSGRTIPESGRVRTRDGKLRVINLSSTTVIGESLRPRIIAAALEACSSSVVIEDGRPISGDFTTKKLKLPITEWTCRKVVARHMRKVAEDAYLSSGFQTRIFKTAKMIYEDKIPEAVKEMAAFLAEFQEFTLLDREGTQRLVENTLATQACFNQDLCRDTATLMWRTNLKVNKDPIVQEWRKTAQMSGNVALLENVRLLEESRNFESAFNKFIGLVFTEATSPREVTVDAYVAALQQLRNIPKIAESSDMRGKIDELIDRLKRPEPDYAVVAEVEDTLAAIKEELKERERQGLDEFDAMPGDLGGGGGNKDAEFGTDLADVMDTGHKEPDGDEKPPNNVTFNINIGGEGGGVDVGGLGGEEGVPEEEPEGEEGGEDELGDLSDLAGLGGAGGGGEEEEELGGGRRGGGGGGGLAGLEGRQREGKTIKEDDEKLPFPGAAPPFKKKGEKGKKDRPDVRKGEKDSGEEEDKKPWEGINRDPYAITDHVERRPQFGADYGVKPIEITNDVRRAVGAMFQVAEEKQLSAEALEKNLDNLAKHGIEAAGLRVPKHKMDQAIEQVKEAFGEEAQRRETLGEEQHRWGTLFRRRGFQKNNLTKKERKPRGKVSESVERGQLAWLEAQGDGLLGELDGVKFILDHGGENPDLKPIVSSEDAKVQVPIPPALYDSAFAAAELAEGDPQPFLEWLGSNIEQLRPETPEHNRLLDEARATITAHADGTVNVEVDSQDPDVQVMDAGTEEMGPVDMPPEGGLEAGGLPGMPEGEVAATEMPDFDAMGGEPPAEGPPEGIAGGPPEGPPEEGLPEEGEPPAEEEEEEEGGPPPEVKEDKDVTQPTAGKYNTMKQDLRSDPKASLPGSSGKDLEGFGKKAKQDDTGKQDSNLKHVKPKGNSK